MKGEGDILVVNRYARGMTRKMMNIKRKIIDRLLSLFSARYAHPRLDRTELYLAIAAFFTADLNASTYAGFVSKLFILDA